MNDKRGFFIELSKAFDFKRIKKSLLRGVAVYGTTILVILSMTLPPVFDAVLVVRAEESSSEAIPENKNINTVLSKAVNL